MRARVFDNGFFDDIAGDDVCEHARFAVIAIYQSHVVQMDLHVDTSTHCAKHGDMESAVETMAIARDYQRSAVAIRKDYCITDEEIRNYCKMIGIKPSGNMLPAPMEG